MNAKYISLIGLLTSGALVGYIIGNHYSPDASKPETARYYLALYGKWQRIDSSHDRITLMTPYFKPTRSYSYTTGDSTIAIRELPPSEIVKSEMPHRDMDKDFDRVVGLTAAGSGGATAFWNVMATPAVTTTATTFSKGEKTAILVATLGSFGAGYWFGHRPEPDTEEPKFRDTLANEVSTWRDYDNTWHDLYEQAVKSRLATIQVYPVGLNKADPVNMVFARAMDTGPCGEPQSDVGISLRHVPANPGEGSLRALHPEICNQVGSDPRVLAALNPPAPAPIGQRFLFGLNDEEAPGRRLGLPSQPLSGIKLKEVPAPRTLRANPSPLQSTWIPQHPIASQPPAPANQPQ